MNNPDTNQNSKDLQKQKRIKFLDFLLTFRGWFTRLDLIEEFKIAPAGATRDISEYKQLISNQADGSTSIYFDESLKRYDRAISFQPEYPLSFEHSISLMKRALKKGALGAEPPIPLETPMRLCNPTTEILSIFSRAISNRFCIEVIYGSLSSTSETRKIAPHSFFESEANWYVRAFCYSNSEFRNFKLTRFSHTEILDEYRSFDADPIRDEQWQRWVNLILEPHNRFNTNMANTIARDYGMTRIVKEINDQNEFVEEHESRTETLISEMGKEVKVRAALSGFWLQHWNVDCSLDGALGREDGRYLLQLANPEALYDVESSMLAPGYNKLKN